MVVSIVDVTPRYDREVDKKNWTIFIKLSPLMCARSHRDFGESVYNILAHVDRFWWKGWTDGILKRGIKTSIIICERKERPRETYLSALLYIVCYTLYHSLMHIMTKGRCNKGHSSCWWADAAPVFGDNVAAPTQKWRGLMRANGYHQLAQTFTI